MRGHVWIPVLVYIRVYVCSLICTHICLSVRSSAAVLRGAFIPVTAMVTFVISVLFSSLDDTRTHWLAGLKPISQIPFALLSIDPDCILTKQSSLCESDHSSAVFCVTTAKSGWIAYTGYLKNTDSQNYEEDVQHCLKARNKEMCLKVTCCSLGIKKCFASCLDWINMLIIAVFLLGQNCPGAELLICFSSVSPNLMCFYCRHYNQLWSLAGRSCHFKLQFLSDVLCGGRAHSMEPAHT